MGAPAEAFGPYVVYEQIGLGGMATVHRAETQGIAGFSKQVALKRMLPNVASDAALVQSFIREARLASHLRHANVAQTYDLGKVGDTYFIAMELVPGHNLRETLKHCAGVVGHMPMPIVMNIINQICDALDYAHDLCDESGHPLGIIHRDVSPSNIIVSDGGVVKLIDFGIAKASGPGMNTKSGTIKGKFGYMAPEYLLGSIDARADLFALGVIAHELLSNRPLFQGRDDMDTLYRVKDMPVQPPSRFNPKVPPEIDAIIMTALERDPDKRWQRANALHTALATETKRLGLVAPNSLVIEWIEWAFQQSLGQFDGDSEPMIAISGGTTELPRGTPPAAVRSAHVNAVPRTDLNATADLSPRAASAADDLDTVLKPAGAKHEDTMETVLKPAGTEREDTMETVLKSAGAKHEDTMEKALEPSSFAGNNTRATDWSVHEALTRPAAPAIDQQARIEVPTRMLRTGAQADPSERSSSRHVVKRNTPMPVGELAPAPQPSRSDPDHVRTLPSGRPVDLDLARTLPSPTRGDAAIPSLASNARARTLLVEPAPGSLHATTPPRADRPSQPPGPHLPAQALTLIADGDPPIAPRADRPSRPPPLGGRADRASQPPFGQPATPQRTLPGPGMVTPSPNAPNSPVLSGIRTNPRMAALRRSEPVIDDLGARGERPAAHNLPVPAIARTRAEIDQVPQRRRSGNLLLGVLVLIVAGGAAAVVYFALPYLT